MIRTYQSTYLQRRVCNLLQQNRLHDTDTGVAVTFTDPKSND